MNVQSQLPAAAMACLLAATAAAQDAATAPASTVVSFDEVRFAAIDPVRPDAMQSHVLWGEPARGPSAMYLKFGRTALPMHLHSADYHLLVVEGTMKHWLRGASVADARSLGPGSYWFQPGGQVHADACLSESCLVFLVWSGQRDGKLAPPEPAR